MCIFDTYLTKIYLFVIFAALRGPPLWEALASKVLRAYAKFLWNGKQFIFKI
jgi:hypothetical protein